MKTTTERVFEATQDLTRVGFQLEGLADALSRVGLEQPALELRASAAQIEQGVAAVRSATNEALTREVNHAEEVSGLLLQAAVVGAERAKRTEGSGQST